MATPGPAWHRRRLVIALAVGSIILQACGTSPSPTSPPGQVSARPTAGSLPVSPGPIAAPSASTAGSAPTPGSAFAGPTGSPAFPSSAGGPTVSAEAGAASACTDVPTLPSIQPLGETTVHFAQSGCDVSIVAVDLSTNGHPLRTVTFSPPLPAGTLDVRGTTTNWIGTGAFHGLTSATSPAGIRVRLDAKGTFQASARLLLKTAVRGAFEEWASGATASSQREGYSYAADQAAGPPNNFSYGVKRTAWSPANENGGNEWIELAYATPIVPAAVKVWENSGAGAVRMIESFEDASKTWIVLWAGTDPTAPGSVAAFSPTLQAASSSTTRIRVTIDTSVPDWNEIDAV